MTSLSSLPAELLLNIIAFISPIGTFTSVSRAPSTLKNLSLTCHRLHTLTHPFLFSSLILHLRRRTSAATIDSLRTFIRRHNLTRHITHIAISFGHEWNSGKVGLTLKRFLWETGVSSLTLTQERPDSSVREKSAKWAYSLDTVQALRLQTIDDDNELKMLLLRACPARMLVVQDGYFKDMYDSDSYFHHDAAQRPAVAFLKPSVFPNLEVVVYTASWPSYNRFDNFLEFVVRVQGLKRLEVTLMGGEDGGLRLGKERYKISGDAVRYREVVAAYQILAGRVEGMGTLGVVVLGDARVPWRGETEPPKGWVEVEKGVYRRKGTEVSGEGVME